MDNPTPIILACYGDLDDIKTELELFEHKLKGGASLDNFLNTGKAKVEDSK